MIPLCVPDIRGNEWRYIQECLDSNMVSSVGSYVDRFESQFAARTGVQHAVATASGTAALHIALLVAGVKPEEEVLVSTFTFIAPANAVRYVGAWPVFVDAEPDYWQIDVARLADFCERHCTWVDGTLRNRASGRRISALLPVDVLGHPVDMAPLLEIADRYDLTVIEDATESLGASYRQRPVGVSAHISCFSFNGNKLMTTGGGGMLVTNNPRWAARARYLTTQAKDDPVAGIHGTVGYNYRLTNLQAAMGCAQLERLDDLVAAKRRIARRYRDALSMIPGLTPMPEAPWAESAFWLYTLRVDAAMFGWNALDLRERLRRWGVESRLFWQPMHQSPAHAGAQSVGGTMAARLHRELLSIPCSCGLTREDQDSVTAAVLDCVSERSTRPMLYDQAMAAGS